MKYQVRLYHKGIRVYNTTVNEANHKAAAVTTSAKAKMTFSHAVVTGKTTKRFTNKLKLIRETPRIFKTTYENSFAILSMYGGIAEFRRYVSKDERDRVYEELTCTTSTSAESVKVEPEPSATIAFTGEMLDSKSGSTSKKIWSGSVPPVTVKDLPTRLTTVKSSGKDKSGDSDAHTWKHGYATYPSKQKPKTSTKKFIAVVNPNVSQSSHVKTPSHADTPNFKMIEQAGHTINLKASYYGEGWFIDEEGFNWHTTWLQSIEPKQTDTPHKTLSAKVKDIAAGTVGSYSGMFVAPMLRYIGRTIRVTEAKNDAGIVYYKMTKNGNWCFAEEWLEFEKAPSAEWTLIMSTPVLKSGTYYTIDTGS